MTLSNNLEISAETFTDRAEKFFSENENKKAIKCYLNSVLIKRLNPKAYKGLGIAYRNDKKYDKAIFALEKAKEMSPFDAEIYSELGICYLAQGNICKAVKHFIKAIKIKPDNFDTQIQLAMAHEIMEEPEMALMIYQRIIEKNPVFIKA